jgi:hypothetical protein
LKEAEHIGDAGSLANDPAQRKSAADGGRIEDRPLAPEEADRYALAFRPSWAPLGVDPQESSKSANTARSARPAASPMARQLPDASAPVENGRAQEDLLQRLGRRSRVRSLGLAGLSVLSFFMLGYWAISSTTDTPSAVRRLAPPSLGSPPSMVPEASASPTAVDLQGTNTAALPSTPLRARLSDPTQPADLTKAEGAPAETADEVAKAGTDTEQPELPAESPTGVAPTDPTAVAQGEGTVSPERQTAGQVETAKTEATPAEPAGSMQPAAASPRPAPAPTGATVVTAAIPAAPATAAPPETRSPAAPSLAPPPARPSPAAQAPAPVPAVVSRQPTQPAAAPTETKPAPKLAAAAGPITPATTTTPVNTTLPAPEKPRSPQLVVHAIPDSAQLWLDGQRMSNPFDTRLPLGSKHKIEARHDGFETSSQSIRLEADARLTITLRRTAPPPAPAPPIKVRPPADAPRGAGFVTSNPY